MAKADSKALVEGSIDQVPAHIAANASLGIGNENIGAGDVEIPQLKLLQAMSPEVQKGTDGYVEGAEPGMIFNTLSRKASDFVNLINLGMTKECSVFRSREFGGGGSGSYIGAFPTRVIAEAYLTENGLAINEYDISDTAKHLVVVLDDKGEVESEAQIYMSSTKLRTSNKWNSELLMTKMDRYASVWRLGTERLSNSKGTWSNFTIAFAGWCPPALLEYAKNAYDMSSGPK